MRLSNPENSRRTVSEITRSCHCTVLQPRRPFLEPGESQELQLSYSAPNEEGDFRHDVVIRFAEADAAPVRISVIGQVRKPISVRPQEIVFQRVPRGDVVSRVATVENYTDDPLSADSFRPTADWLKVHCEVAPGVAPCRQAVRLRVDVLTDRLTESTGDGGIELRSSPGRLDVVIPVRVSLARPVEAIPGQMVFGAVGAGESSEYKVSLLFANGTTVDRPDAIRLSHDLGPRFRASVQRGSATTWFVTGRFDAGACRAEEAVEGTLAVELSARPDCRVDVPVRLKVVPR